MGKLDQRNDGGGDPNFRVVGFQELKSGQAEDAIADGARAYEQATRYSITTGSLTSMVAGRKHISLLHAW